MSVTKGKLICFDYLRYFIIICFVEGRVLWGKLMLQ